MQFLEDGVQTVVSNDVLVLAYPVRSALNSSE